MPRRPHAAALAGGLASLVLALAGCSGDEPATAPSAAGAPVTARLGALELELEVADDPQERARGLMGRTEVPAGTGMLFLFGEPVEARFYMYRVPVPLHAAFLRDGRVVHTVVMPPCSEPAPQDCPTYGPETAFDTVVETSPETGAGVRVGDALTLLAD